MAKESDRFDDKSVPSSEDTGQKATSGDSNPPLPEINFATFIFSLNQSALMNLGLIADPGTGERTKNIPLAKQTIDILALLEEKTKGNLTSDEANMLKSILYDLRIIYVQHSK
jgi:Domain of unknown function (DUF1844)